MKKFKLALIALALVGCSTKQTQDYSGIYSVENNGEVLGSMVLRKDGTGKIKIPMLTMYLDWTQNGNEITALHKTDVFKFKMLNDTLRATKGFKSTVYLNPIK